MIKKLFVVLVLSGAGLNASSVSDLTYQNLSVSEVFMPKVKAESRLSFNIDYVAFLGLVDQRFEKDTLENGPKPLSPVGALVTLSYKF